MIPYLVTLGGLSARNPKCNRKWVPPFMPAYAEVCFFGLFLTGPVRYFSLLSRRALAARPPREMVTFDGNKSERDCGNAEKEKKDSKQIDTRTKTHVSLGDADG